MRIRWKFWKRAVSAERIEELRRIVDEAEPGSLIPMTAAEIKAFTPRLTGVSIFQRAIEDLRNDPVRMAEFDVAWKKWAARFPFTPPAKEPQP